MIVYAVGGIFGALIMGWIADKVGSLPKVLAVGYIGAAVFITVAAFSMRNIGVLLPTMFLVGCCINGVQPCLKTISAIYNPTAIRATGVGWALGIGRIGAVIGPAIGGFLVGAHFAPSWVVLTNVVPAVIGVVAIVLFQARYTVQTA